MNVIYFVYNTTIHMSCMSRFFKLCPRQFKNGLLYFGVGIAMGNRYQKER